MAKWSCCHGDHLGMDICDAFIEISFDLDDEGIQRKANALNWEFHGEGEIYCPIHHRKKPIGGIDWDLAVEYLK